MADICASLNVGAVAIDQSRQISGTFLISTGGGVGWNLPIFTGSEDTPHDYKTSFIYPGYEAQNLTAINASARVLTEGKAPAYNLSLIQL